MRSFINVVVDSILHPERHTKRLEAMLLRVDEAFCTAVREKERLERSVKRLTQQIPPDEPHTLSDARVMLSSKGVLRL